MGKSRHNPNEPAAPWIYNPWLDLIVGCGAWSAPLLLLSYFSLASNARTWSVAFYALALFFNYPHYMATIYRAYHRAEDFQKYRIFTVHITALVILTLLLSHFWLRLLPWIFTIYLTWSPWHYSGQNYGLFMMFARRAGADPDKSRTPGFIRCVRRFLSDSLPRIPYRTFDRSSVPLPRDSRSGEPMGADCAGRGVRRTVGLRAASPGARPPDGES